MTGKIKETNNSGLMAEQGNEDNFLVIVLL